MMDDKTAQISRLGRKSRIRRAIARRHIDDPRDAAHYEALAQDMDETIDRMLEEQRKERRNG